MRQLIFHVSWSPSPRFLDPLLEKTFVLDTIHARVPERNYTVRHANNRDKQASLIRYANVNSFVTRLSENTIKYHNESCPCETCWKNTSLIVYMRFMCFIIFSIVFLQRLFQLFEVFKIREFCRSAKLYRSQKWFPSFIWGGISEEGPSLYPHCEVC